MAVPDGVYSIELPFGGGSITDTGEGRYLNLLPPGTLGPTANQIKVTTGEKGSTFRFVTSNKFMGPVDQEIHMNTKLVSTDKAYYFKIARHPYEDDKFTITTVKDETFAVSTALERIYPPWVALITFPEQQAWVFATIGRAKL